MSEMENWTLAMGAPTVPRVSPALIERIVGKSRTQRSTNRGMNGRQDRFVPDDRRGGRRDDRERFGGGSDGYGHRGGGYERRGGGYGGRDDGNQREFYDRSGSRWEGRGRVRR
jgi:hypothetical protein